MPEGGTGDSCTGRRAGEGLRINLSAGGDTKHISVFSDANISASASGPAKCLGVLAQREGAPALSSVCLPFSALPPTLSDLLLEKVLSTHHGLTIDL